MSDERSDDSVNPFSSINFGLLIAYLLPGLTSLYALTYFSSRIAALFDAVLDKDKNLGASFLILVGSLVVGLIISAFRDLVLDRVHYKTGVKSVAFNYGKFVDKDKRSVLEDLIGNKYRFYQFYGNIMVAFLFLLIARLSQGNIRDHLLMSILNALAVIILFLASRDALRDMFNTYEGIEAEIDGAAGTADKVSGNYQVKLTVDGKLSP